MQDKDKTNKQFTRELNQLHQRIADLEALETERKRANLLLQQEKETFFTILQYAPYGVVLVDGDGNHLYVNPEFTAITGYTLEDIPTKRNWMQKAYPDKAYRQKIEKFWREDSKLGGKKRIVSVVCKNGETKDIEFRTAILDDRRIVAMLVDITERKQMEEALYNSRMHLADAMDMAHIAYWEVDHPAKEFLLNDAFYALYGTTAEAEGGYRMPFEKFIRRFIHPDDETIFDQITEDIENSTNQEQALYHEHRFIHGNGEIRYVGVRSRVFRDASGNIIRTFGANQDITDLKHAEEALQKAYDELKASKEREIERATQLEASNRELEAFSYSVSHDLRAPLRGIDGFSQALLEDYADQLDTQAKDYLQRVRAASQRLELIIDDMLILSRVTRREMRRELVNLSTMAQEIAAELQTNQPERQVSFVIAPWVVVNADPNLIRIALNNLMDNAWKFTSKHPTARIEIGVTANNGEQAYYVHDDGVGFDMAYAGKLFSAFQRLHPITEFGGTGIGLATVQRIIHRHGGRVWAEGAIEQGATFYFTLPK